VHLNDERMLLLLELCKDSSLSHYLQHLVIFFYSVFAHYFHCVKEPRDFMTNEQNFGETAFAYHFFYYVMVKRLILRSLLQFGENNCRNLYSL
jgi:hypothetical protein